MNEEKVTAVLRHLLKYVSQLRQSSLKNLAMGVTLQVGHQTAPDYL